MKQVILKLTDPIVICIVKDHRGSHYYKNITDASKKRLDNTLVDLCKSGKLEMSLIADFQGNQALCFDEVA